MTSVLEKAQMVAKRALTTRSPLMEYVGPDENGQFVLVPHFHPGQIKAWNSKKDIICIFAGNQSGKALALDTPIPTPDGFVLMGNLQVGQQVLDEHGKPTTVTYLSPIYLNHSCYRLMWEDGTTVVADAEHLWQFDLYINPTRHYSVTVPTHTHYSTVKYFNECSDGVKTISSPPVPSFDRPRRKVLSIEPTLSVPVRCITVDSPSHMYLCTESFIPTHNTSFLPWWLWREIYGDLDTHIGKGGGDYGAVTANFPLFDKKFLPELLEVFVNTLDYGKYWAASNVIELKDPETGTLWAKNAKDRMWGRILLGSAQSLSGLASSTFKGLIVDEAGLPEYSIKTYEELQPRVAINEARMLVGTTVYDLGWLKDALYDPWSAARRRNEEHPDIDVIQFDSTENPAFPKSIFEKRRAEMPAWKFDMRYRGLFSRPAGAIYDCFDREKHVCKPFPISSDWPRYLGLDFGGVHMAGVYLAEDLGSAEKPEDRTLYLYREYMYGNRNATDHVRAMLRGEDKTPKAFGGAQSEDQWRREFRAAGLPVGTPDKDLRDVEVGIDRVYAFIKNDHLRVFDTCTGVIEDLTQYSRKLDDLGDPLDDIKDKSTYHFCDGLRYLCGSMKKARWTPVGYEHSPY